jgi:hypothetical protein
MTKLLPKHFFLLCAFSSVGLLSYGQGGEVHGVSFTVEPTHVNLSDVLAYQRQHPVPPDFVAELKPQLEGPVPAHQSPTTAKVAKGGTLVTSTNLNTSTVSSSSAFNAGKNFLTIWGSYASVSGKESPYTPPDNCGDVGPTQVIATANCRMKVFDKASVQSTDLGSSTTTATNVLNVDLNAFFKNTSLGISSISDPHVRFDRLSNRWFIVAIEVNHTTNNYCMVAVSSGPTITGSSDFHIYYFNVSQTGGSSRDFFDYPTLGVDNHFINIGGNMFRSQRSFTGSMMWVVNKTALINNGTFTVTGFPQTTSHTDMYTPQGVQNDDDGNTTGYFIGASQTYYSKLNLRRVNGTGLNAPTLSSEISFSTIAMYTPSTAPTKGGTSIDGGDRRPFAAMIKNNSLWLAQGTKLDISGNGGSGGDRDGALWMQIDVSAATPTILQQATFSDRTNPSSSAYYYIYPSIATSGQGHSFMGFTSAGSPYYANAAATNRFRTDEVATMRPATLLTSATSTYNPGANRWGDYTQTVVDPTDNMTMWTFTEEATYTNSWGVRAAQLLAPPPATPSLGSVCGATQNVTISGTSTNNSEFYNPPTSYAKHLSVSISGPGTATASVSSVSPTSIAATLNFTSAPDGLYTLTVTNPDGQTSSCTFNYTGNCPIVRSSGINRDQPIEQNFSFKVYPNPARAQVLLEISSPVNQEGSLEMYDNLGRLVKREAMSVSAGISQKTLSISSLPAGSYLLQYRDNQQTIIKKQQLIKE